MLESRGKLRPGETIRLTASEENIKQAPVHEGVDLELLEPLGRGQWSVVVRSEGPTDPATLLDRVGQTPLPPYIRRARRQLAEPGAGR